MTWIIYYKLLYYSHLRNLVTGKGKIRKSKNSHKSLGHSSGHCWVPFSILSIQSLEQLFIHLQVAQAVWEELINLNFREHCWVEVVSIFYFLGLRHCPRKAPSENLSLGTPETESGLPLARMHVTLVAKEDELWLWVSPV